MGNGKEKVATANMGLEEEEEENRVPRIKGTPEEIEEDKRRRNTAASGAFLRASTERSLKLILSFFHISQRGFGRRRNSGINLFSRRAGSCAKT